MLEHVYILTPTGVARFLPTFTTKTHVAVVNANEGNYTVTSDGAFVTTKTGHKIIPDNEVGWFNVPAAEPVRPYKPRPFDWATDDEEGGE